MPLFSPNASRAGQRPRPFIGRGQRSVNNAEDAQPGLTSQAVAGALDSEPEAAPDHGEASAVAAAIESRSEPPSALSTIDIRHATPAWLHAAAAAGQITDFAEPEAAVDSDPQALVEEVVEAEPTIVDAVGQEPANPSLETDCLDAVVSGEVELTSSEVISLEAPCEPELSEQATEEMPAAELEIPAEDVAVEQTSVLALAIPIVEHPTLGDLAAVPDTTLLEASADEVTTAIHSEVEDLAQWEAPEQLGPYVAELPPMEGGDSFEAIAAETAARERALEVLDAVARSVRSGEIAIPANAGKTPASTLASILASLLRSAP